MKRISLSLFLSSTSFLSSFAQAWVTDEIAEEAKEIDPLSTFDLFAAAIIIGIIYGCYNLTKYFKTLPYEKFNKIRTTIYIAIIIITVLLPSSIATYFDIKNDRLEQKAKDTLNIIINNADSYIELPTSFSYPSFTEINPYDSYTPTNNIDLSHFNQELIRITGVRPYENVYRCFNISLFGNQVLFAKYAKRNGYSDDSKPALYHGYIKPYRIRYYSNNNVDPLRDLGQVYQHFIQNFIWEHGCQKRDDITNEFFHKKLNDFYELSHIPTGDEMWAGNKLYYENDIVQERTYEYKTINYGNFDVTYCIARPCKLGVCERYIHGKIFGHETFDKAHIVKRNQALARYCSLWAIIVIVAGFTLYYGQPKDNRPQLLKRNL